ncbi:MAG: carboxypeptidase regulatory-like domain-containing protein, partial [Acidobacteriota bacterium]|nr:carboxypeptidase regulatory-like domain-containing protein [Acidobacteriota bacterium]
MNEKTPVVVGVVMILATLLASTITWGAVGKIAGLVTDKDGNPLAGVLVTVSSEDGSVSESTQTNKRGKFNMTIKEPGKSYSVRLERSGYDGFEGPIDMREGETLGAEFKLLSAEEGQAHRAKLEAIEAKNKASRLYNEGVERYNAGDPEGASQKFAEALVERPEMGAALAGIGRIHLEAKRFDQAIEPLARFEQMDPGRMAVLLMLYDAYDGARLAAKGAAEGETASVEERAGAEARSAEMAKKADATLESLITSHPGLEAGARVFNQGVAAVSVNDLERARERFSLVLEIAPDLHPARVNLA